MCCQMKKVRHRAVCMYKKRKKIKFFYMLVYAERNSRSIQKLLQEKTKDITMEEEGAEGKLG